MKLNIHNTLLAASALIIAASTSSCRKDLCYNHFPEAGVTLSYENEWERDYGMGWLSGWDADLYGSTYDNLRPGNPEGVTMVAYHPDGITEFYMSTAGGNVSFGASVHSLLFYNGIYKDKSSAINLTNKTEQKVRNSTYVFNWLNELIENISCELSDDEPIENDLPDEVTATDNITTDESMAGGHIVPLFDFAVCAGNGDFIDESIGHQDFQTENREADYALIISGESMEPTIPNGSIVLVKKVSELANKDIAIVSTGGETMCKRYIKKGRGKVIEIIKQ